MKTYEKITTIALVLLIGVIIAVSFVGAYKVDNYKVKNIIPEYLIGMEFKDTIIANLEVDKSVKNTEIYDSEGNKVETKEEGIDYTEENGYTSVEVLVNNQEVLNSDNYNKSKEIIEKRLKALNAEQYTIRQADDGNLIIELPNTEKTDEMLTYLGYKGEFTIVDEQTKDVLLDKSKILNVTVNSGIQDGQTIVYLALQFNEEGAAKLKEISNTYVESEVETVDEDGETEKTTETKNVSIMFDDTVYRTTYFSETFEDGMLYITVGSSNDADKVQGYIQEANSLKTILTENTMPIAYETAYFNSNADFNYDNLKTCAYIASAILGIAVIYLIIRFKFKGLLGGFISVGYVALLLLVFRYTNVTISISGLLGIVLSTCLSYAFIYMIIKQLDSKVATKKAVQTVLKDFSLALLPIFLAVFIFSFAASLNIASMGLTMAWGIILIYIYDLIFTKYIVGNVK